ncbi:MAG: hypothetical protein WBA61_00140 [Aequorivita sp.]
MGRNSKSILSDLINMVMADGKIDRSEIEFIKKLAKKMGISKEKILHLFENPQPSKPLYNEVDRITHFYKLLLMMEVDDETHQLEITALKNFGLKMGIRPGVADQILKKMDKQKCKTLTAEELLKIFKIYYN